MLSRVNGELFSRSAAHDDYVTAGCSLTAALIVQGHAYVVHTGGTAAYLAHRGDVSALTAEDGLEEAGGLLLARALGTSSALDVAVSSIHVDAGDVMILMGHRVRGDIDRRALIAHVEEAGASEHMLVVRFDDGDRSTGEGEAEEPTTIVRTALCVALGAISLVFGLLFTTAWVR